MDASDVPTPVPMSGKSERPKTRARFDDDILFSSSCATTIVKSCERACSV